MWIVVKDGRFLTEFPYRWQCYIWCLQKELVKQDYDAWSGDRDGKELAEGVEIFEVQAEEASSESN